MMLRLHFNVMEYTAVAMLLRVGIILLLTHPALGLGDGWLANITCNIYGLPWKQDYSDPNSVKFKEADTFFCGKINDIFRTDPVVGNLAKERYHKCFIDNFRQTNRHVEAPVSFTYSLVFSGSNPVPKPVVDGLLTANTETFRIGNSVWTLYADQWLLKRDSFEFVRVNMSDYSVQRKAPPPEIATAIMYSVEVVNITWSPKLADTSSQEFQVLTSEVCQALDSIIGGRFAYIGCNVTSVFKNNVDGSIILNFYLGFGRDLEPMFRPIIAGLISEYSPQTNVDGQVALSIGPVLMLKESLQKASNSLDTKDMPDVNICAHKTDVVLPDAMNNANYIVCYNNQAFPFSCTPPMTFDATKTICVRANGV